MDLAIVQQLMMRVAVLILVTFGWASDACHTHVLLYSSLAPAGAICDAA
jgi:hypothetical protein